MSTCSIPRRPSRGVGRTDTRVVPRTSCCVGGNHRISRFSRLRGQLVFSPERAREGVRFRSPRRECAGFCTEALPCSGLEPLTFGGEQEVFSTRVELASINREAGSTRLGLYAASLTEGSTKHACVRPHSGRVRPNIRAELVEVGWRSTKRRRICARFATRTKSARFPRMQQCALYSGADGGMLPVVESEPDSVQLIPIRPDLSQSWTSVDQRGQAWPEVGQLRANSADFGPMSAKFGSHSAHLGASSTGFGSDSNNLGASSTAAGARPKFSKFGPG